MTNRDEVGPEIAALAADGVARHADRGEHLFAACGIAGQIECRGVALDRLTALTRVNTIAYDWSRDNPYSWKGNVGAWEATRYRTNVLTCLRQAILSGQLVYLEIDPSQDTIDRHGRTLGYVWTSSGRLFNLDMVADGYAYEYTYDLPYRYQADFKAAEADASANDRGLWSPNTCAA